MTLTIVQIYVFAFDVNHTLVFQVKDCTRILPVVLCLQIHDVEVCAIGGVNISFYLEGTTAMELCCILNLYAGSCHDVYPGV